MLFIAFGVFLLFYTRENSYYYDRKGRRRKSKENTVPPVVILSILFVFSAVIITAIYFIIKNVDEKRSKALREQQLKELAQKEETEKEKKLQETGGIKLPDPDPLAFNVVNNIPPIFKTQNLLSRSYFTGILPYNKDKLCLYYSMANRAYYAANNEQITYYSYDKKVMNLNYETCMDKNTDTQVLYDLYSNLYKNFINTDANMEKSLLDKINKTKMIKIKNYFNTKEDFPSFLPTVVPPYNEFIQIFDDKTKLAQYCAYFTNVQAAFTKVEVKNKPQIIIGAPNYSSCFEAFSPEQEYINYKRIVDYIYNPSNVPAEEAEVAKALLDYNMPLV